MELALFPLILTLFLLFMNHVWIFYLILFFRSTAATVYPPGQQILIKRIVDKQDLLKATSLNRSVMQFTKIIGPFLGGSKGGKRFLQQDWYLPV